VLLDTVRWVEFFHRLSKSKCLSWKVIYFLFRITPTLTSVLKFWEVWLWRNFGRTYVDLPQVECIP
jgi:hypothetical protein